MKDQPSSQPNVPPTYSIENADNMSSSLSSLSIVAFENRKGSALTGFLLGVSSLLLFFSFWATISFTIPIPLDKLRISFFLLTLPSSIMGMFLSLRGRRSKKWRQQALIGLICSLAIVLCWLLMIPILLAAFSNFY